MTGCMCRDCRYPTVGDVAVKAAHAEFHARFARLMDERPDWHFRKPTPAQLVVMTAQEWHVPASCVRSEHTGAPRHPAAH